MSVSANTERVVISANPMILMEMDIAISIQSRKIQKSLVMIFIVIGRRQQFVQIDNKEMVNEGRPY